MPWIIKPVILEMAAIKIQDRENRFYLQMSISPTLERDKLISSQIFASPDEKNHYRPKVRDTKLLDF
jgi:hypothetical protein